MPKKKPAPAKNAGPRLINRTVAVIKPRRPFLDWLKGMPDWDLKLTLNQLRQEECTALLIPDFLYLDEAREFVEALHPVLFEMELEGWYLDKKLWPKGRNLKMFREWFDIELHSMAIDVVGGPIRREEL